MEKTPKRKIITALSLLTLALASCEEKTQLSPVIICHDSSQSNFPNAIAFIKFELKNGEVGYTMQSFAGSPNFKLNPDGSLSPFKQNNESFVQTGLNDIILKTPEQEFLLGGCLIDEKDKLALEEFFKKIPLDQPFFEQARTNNRNNAQMQFQPRNSFKGLMGESLRIVKSSKPLRQNFYS